MATVQISLAEYLRTSYHPDRDFADGEVQERNWGEFDHAAVQGLLASCSASTARSGDCMSSLKCEFEYPPHG